MNIFVYSDESGVFDSKHNDLFVFGGVIFLSKGTRDVSSRKYLKAERSVKQTLSASKDFEAKASQLDNKNKSKLYRSLNQVIKFGVIINQRCVHSQIFADKKSKQRYLDYAYKIAVKRAFQSLINDGRLNPSDVENIYSYVDEHTTATNGRYELREALEGELKIGTINFKYNKFYAPIFPNTQHVELKFCNSATTTMVRAADIVANRLFYLARCGKPITSETSNLLITYLP